MDLLSPLGESRNRSGHRKLADQKRGTGNRSVLVRTGVAPLDEQLGGGLPAGRVHLITGGIATGKTTACLHFLGAGVARGEQALLLTSARSRDLRSQATFAGAPNSAPVARPIPEAPPDIRYYGVAIAEVIGNLDQTGLGRVQLRLPWLDDECRDVRRCPEPHEQEAHQGCRLRGQEQGECEPSRSQEAAKGQDANAAQTSDDHGVP